MYNARWILPGIFIFCFLLALPFIQSKGTRYQPELHKPSPVEDSCIEDTAYMAANHMRLLYLWREKSVREGQTMYISSDGNTAWDISFQGTCLRCHSDVTHFCDTCHKDAGISIDCWNCHVKPGGQ